MINYRVPYRLLRKAMVMIDEGYLSVVRLYPFPLGDKDLITIHIKLTENLLTATKRRGKETENQRFEAYICGRYIRRNN